MKILKILDERSNEVFTIGSKTNNGIIVELHEDSCTTEYGKNWTYDCTRLTQKRTVIGNSIHIERNEGDIFIS